MLQEINIEHLIALRDTQRRTYDVYLLEMILEMREKINELEEKLEE